MANVACLKCGKDKDTESDAYRLGHNKKFKKVCRQCEAAWAIDWNSKNKARIKNKSLLRKYGITLQEYNILKEIQQDKCAICKEDTLILCVDHNHSTGKVRGLLCHACNLAIGNLKEDPVRFHSAVSYLERYN